jgi:transposase InsO family protein
MCELAGVSRVGYYRQLSQNEPDQEEMEVREAIQQIAVRHRRRYGYRRMSWELRNQGMRVNHKRVLRLMQEDNLLAVRQRRFVSSTDSRHPLEVHANLAAHMQPTSVQQLWVADITYIRLRTEFVYLAVVLDRFSRRVIGWALDRTLTARLTIAALQQAIDSRQPPPGLVHHSDRGIQYACQEYVQLLRQHGLIASMSRLGNPYDNAACESFMKTLKYEEIHCNQYRNLEDLAAHLELFLEQYYNRDRLHSALRYQSPEQFERSLPAGAPGGPGTAARLSFSRHRGDLSSDVNVSDWREPQPICGSPAHRIDESPAGYSLASCSPAELAAASPAKD